MAKEVKIRIVRDDGKEFNIDGTEWRIPSDGLEGFGSFENDIVVVDNAIGDGGIYGSERIASKDRTIVAKSTNPELNEVLRQSATSFFNSKKMYKVYITYMGRTRWAEGKIHKFNLPTGNIHRTLTMTVTFLFSDPFLKSYDNFGKNIAEVTPMCGFPFLCSVTPKTLQGVTGGAYKHATRILLENDGDVDAFCQAIFTARNKVTNPKLVINGKYVRVIDQMMAGDKIVIDFTKNPPIVQKNGVNYIGHCDRTSDFDDMALTVGTSEVQYDADYGVNMLDVTIYYNKLYGAI